MDEGNYLKDEHMVSNEQLAENDERDAVCEDINMSPVQPISLDEAKDQSYSKAVVLPHDNTYLSGGENISVQNSFADRVVVQNRQKQSLGSADDLDHRLDSS